MLKWKRDGGSRDELYIELDPQGYARYANQAADLLFSYLNGRPVGTNLSEPIRDGNMMMMQVAPQHIGDDSAVALSSTLVKKGFEDRFGRDIERFKQAARKVHGSSYIQS